MGTAVDYAITDEELRSAIDELLALGVPGGDSGHLLGYHLGPGSRFANIARRTELDCFSEAFGETAGSLSREFRPYEDISGFFLVIDRAMNRPAGVARYVDGGVEANPTLRDLETINSMPRITEQVRHLLQSQPGCWDITTTGILAGYRGHHGGYQVMGMLGRMIMLASELYDIAAMSMVSGEQMLKTLRYVGFPVTVLSETPLVYPDGMAFYPCWLDIRSAGSRMLAYLEEYRKAADSEAAARELRTLEPLILAAGTGSGFDEHIDMAPR